MKSIRYQDALDLELENDAFRQEYETLEDEFNLAVEIIALRKDLNLTQRQLAERMGTSQPAIARVESGNYRNLSLSFLRRLAAALEAVPEIHLRRRRA